MTAGVWSVCWCTYLIPRQWIQADSVFVFFDSDGECELKCRKSHMYCCSFTQRPLVNWWQLASSAAASVGVPLNLWQFGSGVVSLDLVGSGLTVCCSWAGLISSKIVLPLIVLTCCSRCLRICMWNFTKSSTLTAVIPLKWVILVSCCSKCWSNQAFEQPPSEFYKVTSNSQRIKSGLANWLYFVGAHVIGWPC